MKTEWASWPPRNLRDADDLEGEGAQSTDVAALGGGAEGEGAVGALDLLDVDEHGLRLDAADAEVGRAAAEEPPDFRNAGRVDAEASNGPGVAVAEQVAEVEPLARAGDRDELLPRRLGADPLVAAAEER